MADESMTVYTTHLNALNNSGVTGDAVVLVDPKGTIVVEIDASGLEPGQVHAQHIHGFADGTDSVSPTLSSDSDHDGFVELAEGQTTYGPIQLNLTTNPDQSVTDTSHSHTDDPAMPQFPTADASGNLHYVEKFTFDPSSADAQTTFNSLLPMDAKEIVLHGETVAAGSGAGTSGEVDGTAGYKGVLPVASGELQQVSGLEANLLDNAVMYDQVFGKDSLAFLTGGVGGALNAATASTGNNLQDLLQSLARTVAPQDLSNPTTYSSASPSGDNYLPQNLMSMITDPANMNLSTDSMLMPSHL